MFSLVNHSCIDLTMNSFALLSSDGACAKDSLEELLFKHNHQS
jgi:hypothetical protein